MPGLAERSRCEIPKYASSYSTRFYCIAERAGRSQVLSLWSRPTSLTTDDVRCVGEFRTTFRTIPAPVAQGIEQRFPKPQVACSIHAGSAVKTPIK